MLDHERRCVTERGLLVRRHRTSRRARLENDPAKARLHVDIGLDGSGRAPTAVFWANLPDMVRACVMVLVICWNAMVWTWC